MGVHNRASAFFLAFLFALSSVLLVVPDQPTVGTSSAEEVDIGDCPRAADGYGYDPVTATFTDHNGFEYSYLPDGVIRLVLPWGYTTYFSYGLTGTYLGVAQKVTALSYTWTWATKATEAFDAQGNLTGYDYSFTATNTATLKWTITLDFFSDSGLNMKVTHTVRNGYAASLLGVEFWYLFDLTHTPSPSVTTNSGTYYPPLYADLPDSITWARLSNQFQFDWREAGWPNGHAYLGAGSVVGLAVDILGISLDLGEVSSGETVTVDPYFSGVTRTWAAPGTSDSNTASNWSPAGVPAAGDNITFDSTSTYNCNWNTAITVGDFKLKTGYSGQVQSYTSWAAQNITVTQGSLTGKSYTISLYGSWDSSGGDWYSETSTVIFLNPATIATDASYSTGKFYRLTFNSPGTYSISSAIFNTISSESYYTVNASTISHSNKEISVYYVGSNLALRGNGVITSTTGILHLRANSVGGSATTNLNLTTFTVSSVVRLGLVNAPSNGTLSGNLATSSSLSVGDGTNRVDWNLASFSLRASSITILNNAYLNGNTGSIVSTGGLSINAGARLRGFSATFSFGGLWASYAGTFSPGTSTVYLTGTGSTIKTATDESFYDLVVGGTYTTQSSLNVSHLLQVNASKSLTAAAGHTVTVDDVTNLGQIIGTGSFVVEATGDRDITLGTVTTAPTTLQLESGATDDTAFTLEASCSLGAGLTVESDHASYELTLSNDGNDLTLTGGDLSVASDANLLLTGGTVALADDFSCAGTLTSAGTDYAVDDDCTLSGAALVDGGDLTVDGDLDVTGVSSLNPDTFGLWAVRVLGAGDLSVTNLSLSTAQDLYVGSGASLTISDDDMGIGGNLTILGSWTRGDMVTTMTGTATLEIVATESFWNITIALGATITMDNDTYVDLRATILGTMAGAGDFIEPEPVFCSTPDLDAVPLAIYNYTIVQGYWDTLSIVDGPAWLSLYGSELKGVPTEADAGSVNVSLLLTWNDMTTYQNYTLWVSVPAVAEDTYLVLEVVISLILCMGFMVLGFYQKKSPWTFVAGLFWLFAALAVFAQLGAGWTMLSLGVGFVLLIDGGRKIAEQE